MDLWILLEDRQQTNKQKLNNQFLPNILENLAEFMLISHGATYFVKG